MEHLPPLLFVSSAAVLAPVLSSVMLFPVLCTRFAGKTAELRAVPVANERAH